MINMICFCKQMINIKLDRNTWLIEFLMLNKNTWYHLSVCEQMINIK